MAFTLIYFDYSKMGCYMDNKYWYQFDALCWSCLYAYGDSCFMTSFKDRTWVIDYMEKLYSAKIDNAIHRVKVHKVVKCKKYKKGRRFFVVPEDLILVKEDNNA